jgi:hypothetical protein
MKFGIDLESAASDTASCLRIDTDTELWNLPATLYRQYQPMGHFSITWL